MDSSSHGDRRSVSLTTGTALTFVILLGVVSLFADMTYEGARSITGPYLAVLGASATVVGIVAGFGELVGYALRLAAGYLSDRTVTVQVVKTGITPPLATSERFQAAKMEPLHPAGRLHMRRGGTPRRSAAVAATWPPPSACLRQNVRPPRSACPSSLGARAHRDASPSLPSSWSVPRLQPGRTSTTPHAASQCPGTSRPSWAHHSACPRPPVAPLPDAVGSSRTASAHVAVSRRAPEAPREPSGVPGPARRHHAPGHDHHDHASLQHRVTDGPRTPDATAPATRWRPWSAPAPGCRNMPPPTAHAPHQHGVTTAPHTPSHHA